jgi:hypothetical protein
MQQTKIELPMSLAISIIGSALLLWQNVGTGRLENRK